MSETDTPTLPPARTFADFGVGAPIVEALGAVGIIHPFPIQEMTLPVALNEHDIIGQAKTGTGKTLGFGIPLLEHLSGPGEPGWDDLAEPGKPQALVVAPTRELAIQVAQDLDVAAKNRSARVLQVYGGRAYEPQIEALTRGVEVVVGTPGRMIDLMNQGHLDLRYVKTVVLDEADEMLDLGFLPDVEKLLAGTPDSRHTMLFSATMPGAVVALARRYMIQPTHIRASDPEDSGATVKAIKQFAYRAHAMDKIEVLARILQAKDRGLCIVFARTKRTTAKVADELAARGFASGAIHGDLGQGAREQALRAFKTGKIDVLVATDVAARGIDVDDVTHVINYQCPEDQKIYLHRTGRTGRAGKTGVAVTFVDWDDMPRWGLIDKGLDLGYPEPEETYSNSPHLFEELDIPEGTTGSLPRANRTREGLKAEKLEDLGETGKRPGGGRGDRDSRGRSGRSSGAGGSGGSGAGSSGRRSGGGSGSRDGGGRSRSRAPRSDSSQSAARPTSDKPSGQRRNRSRKRTGGTGQSGPAAGGGA